MGLADRVLGPNCCEPRGYPRALISTHPALRCGILISQWTARGGRKTNCVCDAGFLPVNPRSVPALALRPTFGCVPIVLQKSQLDLRCTDAQYTPKMGFLAPTPWGMQFLQEG